RKRLIDLRLKSAPALHGLFRKSLELRRASPQRLLELRFLRGNFAFNLGHIRRIDTSSWVEMEAAFDCLAPAHRESVRPCPNPGTCRILYRSMSAAVSMPYERSV